MPRLKLARFPSGRRTGLGLVALAGMLVLLLGMGTAMAQIERPLTPPAWAGSPLGNDPRVRAGGVRVHIVDDRALEIVFQQDVGASQPSRCVVRRNIVEDLLSLSDANQPLAKTAPSRTASMRAFEIGFVRIGDGERSRRIRALVRVRFERVADGKPLRVERPTWFFVNRNDPMDAWTFEPFDGDGYGGAWIDLEKLPIDDLGAMVRRIMVRPGGTILATLPEIGESRAYGIEFGLSNGAMGAFVECLCAMRDPHLSDKRVWDCSRP
jgi:hypothetical protein